MRQLISVGVLVCGLALSIAAKGEPQAVDRVESAAPEAGGKEGGGEAERAQAPNEANDREGTQGEPSDEVGAVSETEPDQDGPVEVISERTPSGDEDDGAEAFPVRQTDRLRASKAKRAPASASRSASESTMRDSGVRREHTEDTGIAASNWVLSVERLSGVYAWSAQVSSSSGRSELDGTMVNALAGNTATNSTDGVANPYAATRITADWILKPGVTLGTGFGYNRAGGGRSDEVAGASEEAPFPDGTSILVTPRVGYVYSFNTLVSVWARTGLTYAVVTDSSAEGESQTTFFSLTLDPVLLVTPLPHVAVLVGPALDIALAGEGSDQQGSETTNFDVKFSNLGAALGAAVYF